LKEKVVRAQAIQRLLDNEKNGGNGLGGGGRDGLVIFSRTKERTVHRNFFESAWSDIRVPGGEPLFVFKIFVGSSDLN
jgi:hypothetical protein